MTPGTPLPRIWHAPRAEGHTLAAKPSRKSLELRHFGGRSRSSNVAGLFRSPVPVARRGGRHGSGMQKACNWRGIRYVRRFPSPALETRAGGLLWQPV